jgi:sugar phosphate permease
MKWKHRYSVLSVLFTAYMLCYLDRMVMATAIPFIAKDLNLSPVAMGAVISAFFVGYAVMQIPGGLLADRFGPRALLTFSIGWWSIMTACTGFVPGLSALVAVRVLFGICEGPFPPAISKALSNWLPVRELGRASGLQYSATALGATLAPLFVTSLVVLWGWRVVFYLLIVPGGLVAILVWRLVRNSPVDSPKMTVAELREYEDVTVARTPILENLRQSLKTPAVLWCAASLFLSNMVAWGLMNWLPTYLLQARGYSVDKMGMFAAITNFAGAIGYVLGGYLCDKYFRGRLPILMMLGLAISAGFTYLAAVAPSGQLAVASLVLVFLTLNAALTTVAVLPFSIVPKYAIGSAFGIVNTAGQLSGVLSPIIVGYILELTNNNFKIVLYFMIALTVAAVVPASRISQIGARR